MALLDKIKSHSAVVGVVGLGFVGLPLAVLQAKTGYRVIGIEDLMEKVHFVNQGCSYISDVDGDELRQVVDSGQFIATTDFCKLAECDVVLICVPTPLAEDKKPDISAIIKVTHHLAQYLHPDMLVVLESTTYPGTTEEVILGTLDPRHEKVGKGLYIAFSPERIDPGNPEFKTHNTYKLIGGVTPACVDIARNFYEQSIVKTFQVSSARVAEMAKVFENVFRSVNIALVNEMTVLCDRIGISMFEVVDAAATKNFGFMPFYPGPGVGGHCIPLDPYYLAWKAKKYGLHTRLIELAGEINEGMPSFVVGKLQRILNRRERLNGAIILILGVTYKANVGDPRESPATKVMELLQEEGADLVYSDPLISSLSIGEREYKSQNLTPTLLKSCTCALILTNHSAFDYEMIVRHASLILDTRNATRLVTGPKDHVVLLS